MTDTWGLLAGKTLLFILETVVTIGLFLFLVRFMTAQFENLGRLKHGIQEPPLTARLVWRRMWCRHRDLARIKVRGFRETRCARCGYRTVKVQEELQR